MDLLQKTIAPLRESFLAMPMAHRVLSGMMVTLIAIGFALLVKGDSRPSTEYLFGGRTLSDAEVDSVEISFGKAGLQGWQREGRRIRIPIDSRSDYLNALQESTSLPLALRSSVQEAIDKASPFESSEQRNAREMHAKARDLSAKIIAFPDIRWASVEYDQGERTSLSRTRSQSASVLVTPEGNAPLPQAKINMIKELIRGSYAGMTSQDVVVIDTNASGVTGSTDDGDPLLRKRLDEEKAYEQKVARALIGYGPIRVAAHVDLAHAPGPLTHSSGGLSQDGHEHASGGEPAMLRVQRVTVSVGLPTSYYEHLITQQFLRENPGKTAEDLPPITAEMLQQKRAEAEARIKSAVLPLLPSAPTASSSNDAPQPLVHVWDYPEIARPPAAGDNPTQRALTWLAASWQTLALLALAALAVLMARTASVARSTAVSSSGDHETVGDHQSVGDQRPAAAGAASPLPDDLFHLIDSDPDLAANVLRSWITHRAA